MKTKSKKNLGSNILKSLPKSVEHIEIVQQVAGVLEELQSRVNDVKAEANKELKKLIKLYEGNYKGMEKKVLEVTTEAKKQAQMSMLHLLQKWHEHKEKLPKPLTNEIEKIIDQIGTKAAEKKSRSAAKVKDKPVSTSRAAKTKTTATKAPAKSAAKTAAAKKITETKAS